MSEQAVAAARLPALDGAPLHPEMERMELSVLVPTYNEAATVETALERVLAADLGVKSAEVVVVDDGSTDGTREALLGRDWPAAVRVVMHERNRGKGAAVRTALAEARGTWTTILDADLEDDPASIAELVAPLRAGTADAVYGIRGFQAHSSYSFWYVAGNKAVSLAANVLYNSWLAEITARLLQSGARIYEVPVVYAARTREEGKKLTGRDGLRVLQTLVRCRLEFGRRRNGP